MPGRTKKKLPPSKSFEKIKGQFYFGDEPSQMRTIASKTKELRELPLMVSIKDFYGRERKKESLKKQGMLQMLKSETLMLGLDSGAFAAYGRDVSFDVAETADIYRAANLRPQDFVINLDEPTKPTTPPDLAREKVENSIKNYNFLRDQLAGVTVAPVIQGWSKRLMKRSLATVAPDAKIVCFPSYLYLLAKSKGYEREALKRRVIKHFREVITMIHKDPDLAEEVRIHSLGVGSPEIAAALWGAGVEQLDSAKWRVLAGFGKVCFAFDEDESDPKVRRGTTAIPVAGKPGSWGYRKWQPWHDTMLKNCECPVCIGLDLNERKTALGFGEHSGKTTARCIHNLFQYKKERDVAREKISQGTFHDFLLRKRLRRGSLAHQIYKTLTEPHFQQLTVDQFFKQRR